MGCPVAQGREGMELASFTFVAFTFFSSLRIFSYVPQILRIASDKNGAMAISYTTWSLWTAANFATALYAAVNLQDEYLTAVSGISAACCLIVIALTITKRRLLPARARPPFDPSEIDRGARPLPRVLPSWTTGADVTPKASPRMLPECPPATCGRSKAAGHSARAVRRRRRGRRNKARSSSAPPRRPGSIRPTAAGHS